MEESDQADAGPGGALILALLAACAAPTPWVKPYEREHSGRSDHVLQPRPDLEHLPRARVRDAAKGRTAPTGAVGGGCGCN